MKKALVLAMVLLLAGCSYGEIARKNNEAMLTLKIGQAKEEVLEIMGKPSRSQSYFRGGKQTDVWYYRTSPDVLDWGIDDNFTPMVFKDGKLTGWGKDYYQQETLLPEPGQ